MLPLLILWAFMLFSFANIPMLKNVADMNFAEMDLGDTIFAVIFGVTGLVFSCVYLRILWIPVQIYMSATRSLYVLTGDRAIEFDGSFLRKVTSCELENVTRLRCSKDADGTGDIGFVASWFDGRIHRVKLGFGAIPHVESVEDLARQLVDTRQDERKKSTVQSG